MKEKIINHLRRIDGFLSGEEMSKALKMSRSAIWKHIRHLRQDGYKIEAVTHKGYRLVACPDKLLPEEIKIGLRTKILGKKIVYYESIDSTMDIASQLAFQGASEGTVVCAETQAKGRGRLGRNWASPKGKSIYTSIVLRPKVLLNEVSGLTLLLAVAVSKAIKLTAGVDARIKWPNDILVNEKKVAGILTELNGEMDRVNFIIAGIGINVNERKKILPEGASSLSEETKRKISRICLLQEVLKQIEDQYLIFQQKGFSSIFDQWRELSITLNKKVKIIESTGFIEGQAVDIDNQGALLIKKKNGTIVKKTSGEVIHLR